MAEAVDMTTEDILKVKNAASVSELRQATAEAIESLSQEKQLIERVEILEAKVKDLEAV